MKEKLKSIILLFFISLILVPSFIYGARMEQKTTMSEQKNRVLQKIVVTPKEVHIPRGSNEQELKDMIEVRAYYRGQTESQIVTDYTTSYNLQKENQEKYKVVVQYQEGKYSKKDYITVKFCSPIEAPKPSISPEPTTKPIQSEKIKTQSHTSIAPGDEDINFPYISGYKDGTFKPNQPVTREELATMLARLITKNQIPTENNQYDDLCEGRFSTDAINYITQLGIMRPNTARTFQPNRKVSHKEFEEIVQRIKPYIKNENTPLPTGDGDLTRVEAVVALNKLFNVQCNTNHESFPFVDVKPGTDAYDDILCATQPRE